MILLYKSACEVIFVSTVQSGTFVIYLHHGLFDRFIIQSITTKNKIITSTGANPEIMHIIPEIAASPP